MGSEMSIIIFVFATVIYLLGYYGGETAEDRKSRKCFGKAHTFNRTGYDEKRVKLGYAMFFCKKCEGCFDEEKKQIPNVIRQFLHMKDLAQMFPEMFSEEWEQVKKYIRINP